MNKRQFIKIAGAATAGSILVPTLTFCGSQPEPKATEPEVPAFSPFVQLPLPYTFEALEPSIDARTMDIHYSKHHAGYTKKLNDALETESGLHGKSIEEILKGVQDNDAQTAIRNNGGGYYNHNVYWECMTPGGSEMPSAVSDAISASFGSVEIFKTQFADAAKTQFGSGWAWLCKSGDGRLKIIATPNQDNPLMTNIAEETGYPLLGIDVWEHAYYLKHKNLRGDYIAAFMDVVNWNTVAARMQGV